MKLAIRITAKCVKCFMEPAARTFEVEISRTRSLKSSVRQALPQRRCDSPTSSGNEWHDYDVVVDFEEVDG